MTSRGSRAREEQILDESLLSVGRRTAIESMAYLFLHLFTRAEEVGLTKGSTIQFPFTQQHVADTLGMSLVHANKTLKKLSATRTMRWKGKVFEILDREALAQIAKFEIAGSAQAPLPLTTAAVARYVKFNFQVAVGRGAGLREWLRSSPPVRSSGREISTASKPTRHSPCRGIAHVVPFADRRITGTHADRGPGNGPW